MMKQYFGYLKDHFTSTWSTKIGLNLLVLLLVLISINYSIDLEDSYIDKYFRTSPLRGVIYFFLQGGSFLLAAILVSKASGDGLRFLSMSKFWFYLIIIFAIYGFERGFYAHLSLYKMIDSPARIPILYMLNELRSLFTLFLPILIFYLLYDRKYQKHFYGVQLEGVQFKPYLVMLAIMLPFILIFAQTDAFQATYPIYGRIKGHLLTKYYEIPEWTVKLVFEALYGLDFFNTELFFRGLLVFVFVRFLGPNAIYAIAVTYCVCHFGKPLAEAISSFFGGYILGVIALYSRNIWGGVLVHAGIALLMDFSAMLFAST